MDKVGAFKDETSNHEISALKLVDGLVYSLSNEIYKISKALIKEGKWSVSSLNSSYGIGVHEVKSMVEGKEADHYFEMKLDVHKGTVDVKVSANVEDSDAVSQVKKFSKESGFSLKIDVDSK